MHFRFWKMFFPGSWILPEPPIVSVEGWQLLLFFMALNLATRGGHPFVNFNLPSFNVKCSQKLFNLGGPFLFPNPDPKLIDVLVFWGCPLIFFSSPFFLPSLNSPLDRTWKCPNCWVSHPFSIWKNRCYYGICFGSACALQNYIPNMLSIFFEDTRRVVF